MKKLMVFFILCCAASAASPPTSAAQDASDYLGPEPGVTLVFESSDGVRIERKTVGMEDGVLRIEEEALIPAEMSPTKESITDTRVYELAAEGARLLQKQPGGNTVLLDLSREKWTVPQDHGGQGP